MGKLSNAFAGAAEHTLWFAFFMGLFVMGLIMASRIVGMYVKPVSSSAGAVLQSV